MGQRRRVVREGSIEDAALKGRRYAGRKKKEGTIYRAPTLARGKAARRPGWHVLDLGGRGRWNAEL